MIFYGGRLIPMACMPRLVRSMQVLLINNKFLLTVHAIVDLGPLR
ncbi:Uncharacterised protein [Legionella waltersii]|nr:Uncharacterised protein [Legionella waltersii]